MSKNRFDDIKENPEFQDFVKNNWHRDINSLQDYEIEEMFAQFQNRGADSSSLAENTGKPADKTDQAENIPSTPDPAENIPSTPDPAENAEDVYDSFHELADKYRYEPKQEDFDDFLKFKEDYLADKTPEERETVEQQLGRFLDNQDQEKMFYGNEQYLVDDDFRKMYKEAEEKIQPAPKNTNDQTPLEVSLDPADNTKQNTKDETPAPTVVPPMPPHEPEKTEPQPAPEEDARIRSFNSDENERLLDMVKVDVLREMEVISDEEWNKTSKLPEQQVRNNINFLNDKLPKMSQKQLAEFEDKVIDRMLSNDTLFDLIPPAALAKAYTKFENKIAQEQDDTKKQDLTAKKDKVGARIEQLTTMLAKNDHTFDDLYFADTTNIADVYEGYVKMYDAMDKNWRSPNDGGPLAQQMRQGEYKLREVYSQYREDYNLKNVTAKDADKLQKRYEDLNKQLSGI